MSNSETATTGQFATGFKKATGELFVYGALFAAGVGVVAALLQGEPGFFVVTLGGLLSAFYFYPFIDTKNAQLGADSRGLYVGGLGVLGWTSIESIEVVRIAVRTVEKAELRITFNRPVTEALLVPDDVGFLRQFMSRQWSLKGDNLLTVQLVHLRNSAETIETELNRYQRG